MYIERTGKERRHNNTKVEDHAEGLSIERDQKVVQKLVVEV